MRAAGRMRLGAATLGALATLYALCLPAGALATPGDLDPSFASHGIYPGAPPAAGGLDGSPVANVAIPDGGALLLRGAGQSSTDAPDELVRLTQTGQLDTSFADNGVLRFPEDFSATGLALDDQGRAVISGSRVSEPSVVAARVTPAGAFDPAFGDGGYASIDLGHYPGTAEDVVIPPGGGVMLAMAYGGYDEEMFLAKLHGDGGVDGGFGTEGVSRSVSDMPTTLMVDPSGGFLVAGTDYYGFSAGIARFDSNGHLDRSYGQDGLATPPVYGGDYGGFGTFAVDPAGGVIVAFTASGEHGDGQYLVRVDPGGGNDQDFNGNAVLTSSDTRGFQIDGLAVEPSGDIVVAGTSGTGYPTFVRDPVIARIAPEGALDQSFGIGGRSDFPAAGVGTTGFYLPAAESDGSILATGTNTVYRLLNGPGDDADADSFPDPADECPRFPDYRSTGIGCPDLAVTLTLAYGKKSGFTGAVTAPHDCRVRRRSADSRRDVRVRIVRVRTGGDRAIGTARVNQRTGAFHLEKRPAPGRFRAEYQETVDPDAGRCLSAHSARVTVHRVHRRLLR